MADSSAPLPAAPSPAPSQVAVADDSGKVHLIDSAGLQDAVVAGMRPLGRAEALQGLEGEYEQSGLGQLATAGAGYLRGLTGGLSDLALDRTGALPGSELQRLTEVNPTESALGHAGGLVGGLVAGGEGSGLDALAGGVPGGLGALGRLAEAGVTKVAGKGALATFARSAVEGAGYQVADNLSEDVLHDKQLTAESLFAHTGAASLFAGFGGATFEKALGIAKTAVPKTLDAAAGKLEDLKAWDEARSPEVKAGEFADQLDNLAATREGVVEDAVGVKRRLIEQALQGKNWIFDADAFAKNLDGIVQPISEEGAHKAEALAAIGKFREEMGDARGAIDQWDAADQLRARLGALSSFDKDVAVNQIQRIRLQPLKDAFSTARDFLEDPKVWGKAAEAQRDFNARLSPFLNDMKRGDFVRNFFARATDSADADVAVQGKVSNDFKALQYLKRESMTTPEGRMRAAASRDALDGAIAQTQDLQQFAADQATQLGTGTAKVRDVKAAIDALQQARQAGIKAAGPSALEWLDRLGVPLMLRGPIGWAGRLSKQGEVVSAVAGAAAKVAESISAGARMVLNGSSGEAGMELVAAASPNIAHWLDLGGLAAQNADPAQTVNQLASATPSLQQHAPTVATHVQQTAATAARYMQSIAPKNPLPPSGLPGQPAYEPSAVEIERHRQAAEIAEHPLSLLEKAQDGSLLSLHVDAMAAMFPAMYQKIVDETQQALAERREPVSYRQQLMLATLLRHPVGFGQEQLAPMFQQQASPAPTQQPQPRQGRGAPSRMGKARFSSSAQTGLQSAEGLDQK